MGHVSDIRVETYARGAVEVVIAVVVVWGGAKRCLNDASVQSVKILKFKS